MTVVVSNSQSRQELIVGHVARSGREFGVGLDNLVDCLQKVFLRRHFPASADGEHARLRTHAANLRSFTHTPDAD